MSANLKNRFRPSLEGLEDRQLLSWGGASPSVANLSSNNDWHYNINLDPKTANYSQIDSIVNSVEVDYRTFTAPRSGTFTFEAQAYGSNIDTVAGLFNGSGYRLAYNDDSGGT